MVIIFNLSRIAKRKATEIIFAGSSFVAAYVYGAKAQRQGASHVRWYYHLIVNTQSRFYGIEVGQEQIWTFFVARFEV